MNLSIGEKITIKKVSYTIYDIDGNYLCLKCNHAYLVNRECANCGAKKRTQNFTNGNIDKEYKDTTVKKVLAMLDA